MSSAASSAALRPSEDPTRSQPEEQDRDGEDRRISPRPIGDRPYGTLRTTDETGAAHQPERTAQPADHEDEERLEDVVEAHVRLDRRERRDHHAGEPSEARSRHERVAREAPRADAHGLRE